MADFKKTNFSDDEIINKLDRLIHLGDSPIGKGFGIIVDKQTLKEMFGLISRLKAENKNCGKKILNQREQLKATNQKIKEQQAEIERLQKEIKEKYETIIFLKVQSVGRSIDFCNQAKLETAKSEAVKEFAKRLKKELAYIVANVPDMREVVDNLLKEMGCKQ